MTEAVFNQLLAEYLAMRVELMRFLTARLGERATAEDLYQELFVRLRQVHLSEEVTNMRGFIFRAAYNLANEHTRTIRRRHIRDASWVGATTHAVGLDPIHDQPGADMALEAKQRLKSVVTALQELTPRCRDIFTQCRVQGLSHQQIADRLGISTKAVEKHMTTALKHLALKFRDTGGEAQ